MPNEAKIRQAATDVQQKILDLSTWELFVSRVKSEESQVFSLTVELTEPSIAIYPTRYIRVTLIGVDTNGNISNVSLDYGWMIQQSGNFSVDAVLDVKTFDNYAESAMKNVPFLFQNTNVEATTNLLTSLAYEFISKLIHTLTLPNHPESQ
ncbi:hypothetical protein [Nostoc sp. LPT]|uniref:hypothetical protein n=1 Tax=Nostoc sp. LPT TaxID=2815387 RepID=UPI001DEBA6A5|nr:hypothetical protein [Nostoc sp. LPT]MBN4005913.1 hypothetical protein [Nostoc sp. LPT]